MNNHTFYFFHVTNDVIHHNLKYFGINHLMNTITQRKLNCRNEEFFTSVDYLMNHKNLKGLFKFLSLKIIFLFTFQNLFLPCTGD